MKLHLFQRPLDSRNSSQRNSPQSEASRVSFQKPLHPLRFLRPMQKSRNSSIESQHNLSSSPSKQDFWNAYSNLPRISKRKSTFFEEETPFNAYLDAVEKFKLKPNPIGIVKRQGRKQLSIDIHQYSMGDTYAKAFSEGVKGFKDVKTLNLKSNRLSDEGAAEILKNFTTKKVKKIILSENRLSNKSIVEITSIIRSSDTNLKVLELENTHLSVNAISALCRVLSVNKNLVKLSLAKNYIDYASIPALSEMLKYNESIQFLDLHWNCLGLSDSSFLIESLGSNDGLIHVDLSYNSFGRKKNSDTAEAFSKMFKINQFLQHVDLSNNDFSKNECEIMSKGLNTNHLIVGLHMQGNSCIVDAKGYLIPLDYLSKFEQGHLHKRIMDTPRYKQQECSKLNCWICEEWVEIRIKWDFQSANESVGSPFFIHLDCDNFQETLMNSLNNSEFEISRMVPSGPLKFFFSDSSKIYISKEYNTQILEKPVKAEYPSQKQLSNNYLITNKINIIYIESEKWNFKSLPNVKPRNDPKIKAYPQIVIDRIVWTIENSIFKDYVFDNNKELLDQCCEFDFEVSNLQKILPGVETVEIKKILRDHYEAITRTFRFLSAISGIELFSISKNVLAEFFRKCEFHEEKFFSQDFGVIWNLSNALQSKNEKFNAGNGLCRYEFTEFLVRLAIDQNYRTKLCETVRESVEKLMKEHISVGMKKVDQSQWLSERYLNEDIDIYFKLHRPVFEGIFFKYAAMGEGSMEKMNLHEFRNMCYEAGICSEAFVIREIDMCFRQAMMTEVDEIRRNEHLEMVYVEFIEAVARLAEQFIVDKNGKKLSLFEKLQMFFKVIVNICPLNIRKAFDVPTESDYHNMKYQKSVIVMEEYVRAK